MSLLSHSRLRIIQIAKCHQQKQYTTNAVPLSFNKYSMKSSTEPPILICHGLFGSKQNWSSLSKALSSRLSRDVYSIDLRNHGESPHSTEHTYQAMTADLVHFIKEHNLNNPVLLGHSMGAKVVMTTALENPDMVSKLIAVDMPPIAMQLARSFGTYCDAMKAIEEADLSKQSEADKVLAKYESDIGVRMFLLTNLKRTEDNKLRFRVPYSILKEALEKIGGFDVAAGSKYDGPTLFIAGGASPYLKPFQEKPDQIKALFPNSQLEVVPKAGHWVHAEKPDAVLNLITNFIGA